MYQLQDVSLLMNEFYGMTDITSWLLTTISKKQSFHSESSLLYFSSRWSIYFKDENDFHIAYKGEDQNSDLSYGQLNHNVGISDFELKKMNLKLY